MKEPAIQIRLADVFVEPTFEETKLEQAPDGTYRLLNEGDWYSPETGAHIMRGVFENIHDGCGGNNRLIREAAKGLQEMFGISMEEATRRIQEA